MKLDHLEIKNFNFVGLNSQTSGEITFFGKTYFYGKHQGNIVQADNDQITIHAEAELIGDLRAENASVFGKVNGNINISGTLNVFSGGVVEGTIRSKNLNIHPGAIIIGEMNSVDSL